jgi:hypothetical protein
MIHEHEIVKGIRADVGKIGHMKELQQLEILFYNSMDIPGLLLRLNEYLNKNVDLDKPLQLKDLQGVDSFVKSFFVKKIITENELWIVRGFVIGKVLEAQEKMPTIYQPMIDINKLPKTVKDAAKDYNLTLRETKALEYTVSEGMKNLTNATLDTIRRSNAILFDNIKNRRGTKELRDALQNEFLLDEGEVNRNWKKVAISETNNAFNQGFISQVKQGEWVYGLSLKDRCEHCGALIDGKFYPVIRIPSEDLNYSNLNPKSNEYKRLSWIWQNGIWAGKDNLGRSGSKKKRIDSDTGNKKENLIDREDHEIYTPVIPMHPYCRCRWIHFYPDKQYLDSNGNIKLRLMDEGAWQKFYDKHIQPIIHEFAKRNIKL